jgi:hypothetical protein
MRRPTAGRTEPGVLGRVLRTWVLAAAALAAMLAFSAGALGTVLADGGGPVYPPGVVLADGTGPVYPPGH